MISPEHPSPNSCLTNTEFQADSIGTEEEFLSELEKAQGRVISSLYEWTHFVDTGEIIKSGKVVASVGEKPISNMVINGTEEEKAVVAELIREKNEEVKSSFEHPRLEGSTLIVTRINDERERDVEFRVYGISILPLGDIVAVVKDPAIEPFAPRHKMTCFSKPSNCTVSFK